jgi:hypothetical protein
MEFVRKYLSSDNILQPPIHQGHVYALLEDEQMFRLGEFVDGPYNKDPTVKTTGSRGVYGKFHAHF